MKMMKGYSAKLYRKSVLAVAWLDGGLPGLLWAWVLISAFAGLLRISFAISPINSGASLLQTVIPYFLLALSPVVAFWAADRLVPRGSLIAQPDVRLSRIGHWRSVDVLAARAHPLFGPTGAMASLLIGMLLNVPLRSLEFLAAVPAMNSNAPIWGQVLFVAMATDVIVMNFLYALCFMAALRCAPWFPRFLLLVWGLDISSQLIMAHSIGGIVGLPQDVADAWASLLYGNMQKVMISVAVWLPYLIMSKRVNLTYRGRIAVQSAQ